MGEDTTQSQLDVPLQSDSTVQDQLLKNRFMPANVARSGANIFGSILGNVAENTRAVNGINLSKPFSGYCFWMLSISPQEFEERVSPDQYKRIVRDSTPKVIYEYFVYAPEISGCLIVPDMDSIGLAFNMLAQGPGTKDVKALIKNKAATQATIKELEKLDMFPRFYSLSDKYARSEVSVQLFNKVDFTKGAILGSLASS